MAGLSELKKHEVSKKHQQNMSSVKETRPITQMVTHGRLVDQVKQAEIKIAAFIVEHNLPFHVIDHLSDLVSNAFPDSIEFSSKRTKTCCIVKHVIAKRFRDELEELLRHT